jgi:patatin-like phospholipase/acyl hydrolase
VYQCVTDTLHSDNGGQANRFRVLSLCGGGLNGAIAAGIIKSVEETTGKRLVDHFDLIVGTSTGGILALGLSLGLTGTSLFDFYRTRGSRVFPPSRSRSGTFCKNLFTSKYSETGLQKELQDVFGDHLLGECQMPVVITSYDLAGNDIRLFKTRHHPNYEVDHKLAMWKVARATSAAPSYLPACRDIEGAQLIDGGVFANNPIMIGVTEAVNTFGVSPHNIEILSIGTTRAIRPHRRWLDKAGLLLWGLHSTNLFFDGQSALANSQAARFVGKERVLHIDPVVAEGEFCMDRYIPDRHDSLAASCARHNMPEIRHRFFSSPANIGRKALLTSTPGVTHAD